MNREIATRLREQGFRATKARVVLLEVFEKAAAALSAAELLRALSRAGITVNKTTVYRELDFLVKNDLVQEVDLGEGQKRYELIHHHHHLICTECQQVSCLATDELEQSMHAYQEMLQARTGFVSLSHHLNFAGLCPECQARN